jgi:excisionase family DNA binding protein
VSVQLLTFQQAAERLHCSPRTLRRRVAAGALPVVVDVRLVRIRETDLVRYVDERRTVRVAERAEPLAALNGVSLADGARCCD